VIGNSPPKAGRVKEFISLIIAPVLTGIVIELFSYWLDKKDDN